MNSLVLIEEDCGCFAQVVLQMTMLVSGWLGTGMGSVFFFCRLWYLYFSWKFDMGEYHITKLSHICKCPHGSNLHAP